MSKQLKLNTLYKIIAIDKFSPQGGIEIVSALSDVTIRATTDSDFAGSYSELPEIVSNGATGEFYKSDVLSVIKYISVSCADTNAKIILSNCQATEIE